jgi:hypothetical protein
MTTYTFADRYSQAGVAPAADKIILRENAVNSIVSEIESKQILDLVMFYYGKTATNLEWLRDGFAKEDASFSLINNEREARVLSALILSKLIDDSDDLTILAVTVGSVRGMRKPPESNWLVYDAEVAYRNQSIANRQCKTVKYKIQPNYTPKLEDEIKSLIETNDLATTALLLSKVRNETRTSATSTSSQVTVALQELEQQILIMREESQMLWWLMGGFSNTLNRSFASTSSAQAAFAGAADLWDLTTSFLGPLAIPAMLERIVAFSKKSRKSSTDGLDFLIDSFPVDDLQKFNIPNNLSPFIAPITAAINMARVTDAGVWHDRFTTSTGFEASLPLDSLSIAEQLYRELLLGEHCD